LQRNLDYRRKLIPDLSSAFVKGVVSIVLALTGAGVWAIVFGQLSGAIASVLMVWIIFPWWPRLSLNLRLARGLIRFGASIMGTDAISITTENIDSIIVGRIFGLSQLSIYSLAYRLPEMLLLNNLWVMGGVIFPAFSTIQTQPDELRKGFLVSIRLIELITLPICLGLIIAATPIVLVLFGEQWLEVVPLLRVFAIYAWVSSIGYHVGDIYKARGRPDILLKLSIVTLVIIIPALLIGSRFGILGIAISHLVAMIIRRGISLTIATRLVKVSFLDILRELKPAFQGGSILTIVTLMVLLVTANMSVFLQLTLIILSGAFSYFCVLWLVERRKLLQLVKILKTSQ
jgi:O-antigen/teichoic acid export membrane protein